MSDKLVGIYRKYEVRRLRDRKGKHKRCQFFVLDWVHDPFAIIAVRAYAKACMSKYPALAMDLERWALHYEALQSVRSEDAHDHSA